MKSKRNIALLAIVLFACSWAFADTYQFTVTYTGPVAGTVVFDSTSLSPNFITNGPIDNTPPAGMFLAQFQSSPASCCTPDYFSVVWDINGNPSQFINEIVYNNNFGDWALGITNVSGNYGSDFCCGGQGNDFGTVQVEDITTPEPGSLALLGSGLIGLAGTLRRKILR